MHSPTKQHDQELYQEVILMMETLVPYVEKNADAKEAMEGFATNAENLKYKINNHDYTDDDEKLERMNKILNQ